MRRVRAVDNLPRAQHFPDRGLLQLRSAGVDSLSQSRQQPSMAAQPLLLVCPDRPRVSSRRSAPAGAVENDDLIGCRFDDGDTLALPVHADADRAFALMDAACRRHHEDPWAAAAVGRGSPGADLGQRLVDLVGPLLTQTLVRR